MAQKADSLSCALASIELAHDAIVQAASILRNDPEHDDFASAAMRLEAHVAILATEIGRAVRRTAGTGVPPVRSTHAL